MEWNSMLWKCCTEYSWVCTQWCSHLIYVAPLQYMYISPSFWVSLAPPYSHLSSHHFVPFLWTSRSLSPSIHSLSLLSLATSTVNPCCTLCPIFLFLMQSSLAAPASFFLTLILSPAAWHCLPQIIWYLYACTYACIYVLQDFCHCTMYVFSCMSYYMCLYIQMYQIYWRAQFKTVSTLPLVNCPEVLLQ